LRLIGPIGHTSGKYAVNAGIATPYRIPQKLLAIAVDPAAPGSSHV
jgi:hypothetical protein